MSGNATKATRPVPVACGGYGFVLAAEVANWRETDVESWGHEMMTTSEVAGAEMVGIRRFDGAYLTVFRLHDGRHMAQRC